MSEPNDSPTDVRINLFLDSKDYIYHPGDCLTGSYRILDVKADEINSIETSVFWRTEGKGDEDVKIVDYRFQSRQLEDWINPYKPGKIETVLPSAPLSYEGQIIKIRWVVQVKMTLVSGEQVLAERVFWLRKNSKTDNLGKNIRFFPAPIPPYV